MTATPVPNGTIILPPPAIKAIVDKTAAFIAKSANASLLEDKFRQREKTDSRFAFLNDTDPYHAYYADRLTAFKAGEQPEQKEEEKADGVGAQAKDELDGRPAEPPALEFLVEDPPKINAVDLDILRLTALFTARSGRKFTSDLAAREARNYQFDFLRPTHSLFGYFNRLVEQYTKILVPSKELISRVERRAGGPPDSSADRLSVGRREVLKDARQRVEWEKWESERRKEEEDKAEAERIAFAEIDWQDFQVASTIEFTENDEAGIAELPPPMSLSEVENMSIAQKKMAAMIMEGQEPIDQGEGEAEEAEMEMDDEDEEAAQAPEVEYKREDVVEVQTLDSNLPVKIRKDYVRSKKSKAGQAMTTFQGQQVPVEELSKHIRYETLDPRWKEEKRQADLNRAASAVMPGGTDVSASLRSIAAHRPDIFGGNIGDAERQRQAEQMAKSRAREKQVWDGHAASKESITLRYQQTANLDEQIAALHKAKGVLATEESNIGPSIPTNATQSAPVEQTTLTSGASISAAPQPAQITVERTTSQNFLSTGIPSGFASPAGASPAPGTPNPAQPPAPLPAGLPARPPVAAPGDAVPGSSAAPHSAPAAEPATGTTRPLPSSFDASEPSAKRARRTDGHVYPEEDWLATHPDPVRIKVQLPDYPEKPAWGCRGQQVELEVPLTLLIGTVRDRISGLVGVPVGKQRYMYNDRLLANATTLAALNLDNGDVLTLQLKDKK
ncbi:Splicing factor 3A subunit 1 [Rhodotorula toruloides]|nr:Splicing factor 3A subunit 1 [Rhodotorula toruloides]